MNFKSLLILPVLTSSVLFSACSSEPNGDGRMVITVQNSLKPAGLKAGTQLPAKLQVSSFKVTVSGDDFSPPVETYFPVDTAKGSITGVPSGDNRTVIIEALNFEGRVIRKRKLDRVKILRGKETPIVASLLSVPFLIQLADGNLITQTRLKFEGYGEPGAAIETVDAFDEKSVLLTDTPTQNDFVISSEQDGRFLFSPPLLPEGDHHFTVQDPQSGEETTLHLTLIPPGRQPGTALTAEALRKAFPETGSDFSLGSLGQFSQTKNRMTQ